MRVLPQPRRRRPRASDDLPLPDEPNTNASRGVPFRRIRVSTSRALADIVVAAEEDAGVLLLKDVEARVRRAVRIPAKVVGRVESRRAQSAPQPVVRGIAFSQAHDLVVQQKRIDGAVVDSDREDALAQRPRLGQLGKAPPRGQRVPAAQDNHRAAAAGLR